MKHVILLFALIISTCLYAQEPEKTVSITVSGSGKTQDEAKQSALRSAIEQAFGAFISSKTEMLNDKVVADQMTSVANGNIKSFSILTESQLPDNSWGVTLKAVVSVSKLTSFVEAKGVAIEIKGGMFALNIKQQLLNEQGEVKAVSEMVGLLHEPMQISFDYVIKSSDPKSLDAESKNWEIPLVVTATANKNMDFCANYCIKTLAALSLSSEEVASYKSLNKAVFPVNINYNGVAKNFYLRKQESINALNTFTSQWEFYTRLFIVKSDLEEQIGNINASFHSFTSESLPNSGWIKTINFLTIGQHSATFSWAEKRTLIEIEKMKGLIVKPRGVVSQFKYGGLVVYEKGGSGLVTTISDIGNLNWKAAKNAINGLAINGYSDWRLPTFDELKLLKSNLSKKGIGNFSNKRYWSSTITNTFGTNSVVVIGFGLADDYNYKTDSYFEGLVRPVRTFPNNNMGIIENNEVSKSLDDESLENQNKLIIYTGEYKMIKPQDKPNTKILINLVNEKLYISYSIDQIQTKTKEPFNFNLLSIQPKPDEFTAFEKLGAKVKANIQFHRDSKGSIVSLTLVQNNIIIEAEK